MSTVSIGSNKKYAQNWDSIFKKGKAKKASAQPEAPAKKGAAAKNKKKATKAAGKSGKRKG